MPRRAAEQRAEFGREASLSRRRRPLKTKIATIRPIHKPRELAGSGTAVSIITNRPAPFVAASK